MDGWALQNKKLCRQQKHGTDTNIELIHTKYRLSAMIIPGDIQETRRDRRTVVYSHANVLQTVMLSVG